MSMTSTLIEDRSDHAHGVHGARVQADVSGSSSSTGVPGDLPQRSSRRSFSARKTVLIWCSRSMKDRPPAWLRSISSAIAYSRRRLARADRYDNQRLVEILTTNDNYDPDRLTFDREQLRRYICRAAMRLPCCFGRSPSWRRTGRISTSRLRSKRGPLPLRQGQIQSQIRTSSQRLAATAADQ